jgi:hypothetical protein
MKELINLLTKNVGVNDTQAEGGAAVLFKAAKDKLGAAEFDSMLGSVPGLTDLMKKAPAAGGAAGGLGGMLGGMLGSMAGGLGGNAALISTVLSGFGKLGLTADHAKKFAPVIMQFLRSKVSPDVVSRLENTLRA